MRYQHPSPDHTPQTVETTASACTRAVNGTTYTASGDYTSVTGCVTTSLPDHHSKQHC
ncbi:MAG: hypothetical protein IPH88_07730 [Bacteroidales bacterium]|nr:hypothetical protein [Bacteroidales bacterium]